MARRQRFKHHITGLLRCRRAVDAPLVVGFAKVSGCLLVICNWEPEKLCCGFQAAYSLPIRQPENWLGLFQKVLHHDAGDVVQTKAVGIGGVAIGRDGVDDVGQILRQQIARAAGIQSHFGGGFA